MVVTHFKLHSNSFSSNFKNCTILLSWFGDHPPTIFLSIEGGNKMEYLHKLSFEFVLYIQVFLRLIRVMYGGKYKYCIACLPNPSNKVKIRLGRERNPESIQCIIDDQASSPSWYLASYPPPIPPSPTASCLSFSVFLYFAGQAY
jgi:hypothetical protein